MASDTGFWTNRRSPPDLAAFEVLFGIRIGRMRSKETPMLRYIRIKEELNSRVEALIEKGDYADFNSAAVTALENLVTAEEELVPFVSAPKGPTQAEPEISRQASPASEGRLPAEPALTWKRHVDVPSEFIVPFSPDEFQPGQMVPLERWLFGQQNRAFPAKVNARLFVDLLAPRGEPIELHDAAHEISVAAGGVFLLLHKLDLKNGHQKDDLLSTGFPQPNSDKSASRYANQFVAYEDTKGRLTGMMVEWKLAGVKRVRNKTCLFPTQACVDFSALENPLLDHQPCPNGVEKFSEQEIAWALQHIAANVPVEASAFKTILAGIQSGAKSPDTLDEYVRIHATEKPGVTKEFVSTQRTGAVSRMADLNMVMRVRDGIRIFYELTERGSTWLQSQKQQTTN